MTIEPEELTDQEFARISASQWAFGGRRNVWLYDPVSAIDEFELDNIAANKPYCSQIPTAYCLLSLI